MESDVVRYDYLSNGASLPCCLQFRFVSSVHVEETTLLAIEEDILF